MIVTPNLATARHAKIQIMATARCSREIGLVPDAARPLPSCRLCRRIQPTSSVSTASSKAVKDATCFVPLRKRARAGLSRPTRALFLVRLALNGFAVRKSLKRAVCGVARYSPPFTVQSKYGSVRSSLAPGIPSLFSNFIYVGKLKN